MDRNNPINSIIIKDVKTKSLQNGFDKLLFYFSLRQLQHGHFNHSSPSPPHFWRNTCLFGWCVQQHESHQTRPGQASPSGEATRHIQSFHLNSEDFSLHSREEIIHIQNDLGKNKQQSQNCCAPTRKKHLSCYRDATPDTNRTAQFQYSVCQGFLIDQTDTG